MASNTAMEMTREIFLQRIDSIGDEEVSSVARRLIAWAENKVGPIKWGKGPSGRGAVQVSIGDNSFPLVFLRVTGDLSFDFYQLTQKTELAREPLQIELRERLNWLPNMDLSLGDMHIWLNAYRMAHIADPEDFQQMTDTLEWMLRAVRRKP